MKLALKFITLAFVALGLGPVSVFAAVPTQLRAYAGVAGGLASGGSGPFGCATSGPVLGGGWTGGLRLPTEGFVGCNLFGGLDDRTAAAAPLTAAQTLAFAPIPGGGSFVGNAQARASYWSLGVAASGTMTGATSAFTYHQSAAFASFSDTITLASSGIATGTLGTINFGFLIAGAMASNPRSPFTQQADARLQIRVNSGSVWTTFGSRLVNAELPFLTGGSTGLPGAFTLAPGSLTGSANVMSTAFFQFQWGLPFSVEVAMSTEVEPCCLGTSFSSTFLNSAVLSGINAYSPTGQVALFSVSTDSGAQIGAGGLTPVPEPASALALLAGLVALAGRWRCCKPTGSRSPRRSRTQCLASRAGGAAGT